MTGGHDAALDGASRLGKGPHRARDREQVIVSDEPDPAADALVRRSAAALDSIAGWPEDQIDALITALAAQIAAHADEPAAATAAETGIGCVPDKADKNRFASLGVARSLSGSRAWAWPAAAAMRR